MAAGSTAQAYVRVGSNSDLTTLKRDFRNTRASRRFQSRSACRKCANSGRRVESNASRCEPTSETIDAREAAPPQVIWPCANVVRLRYTSPETRTQLR